jgi:hypothetical protein
MSGKLAFSAVATPVDYPILLQMDNVVTLYSISSLETMFLGVMHNDVLR